MAKIIIGIHGLGNKPGEQQLQSWWQAAIREGLEGRGRFWFLKFKLVYWASVLHSQPLNPLVSDKKDSLFLKEPYYRGNKADYGKVRPDEKNFIRHALNEQMDRIFLEKDGSLNLSRLTDFILRHFVKDLDAYYKNDEGMPREKICRLLADSLIKHRRKKILLIAHSMGSILALDVLTKWVPQVKVHTLVTIGSPLGNPVVRSKILSGLENVSGAQPLLQTPENILENWFNLSDYKDRVALSYDLNEDFLPNSRQVQPQDKLVWNNYEYKGERNPHKSYGYLRCPEMADILSNFLKSGR